MLRLPQAVAAICDRRTSSRMRLRKMWEGLYAPTQPVGGALRPDSPAPAAAREGAVWWFAAFFTLALTFPLTLSATATQTSEPAPLAAKSLLLDIARAGDRLVAVGDRGHVLLSDDEGRTWRQIIVPTRAMLTGVDFANATHGWAVGHDGVILATTDAGLTWTRQESGQDLETVFLDVRFLDATRGFAVGAYGKCLITTNGGQSWTPSNPSEEEEPHFNQIAAGPDRTLYLTGEFGTLLASRDIGGHWEKLDVPYEGSLFGLLALGSDSLLVHGLRGHIYVSADRGASWTPRETAVPALIMTGLKMKSGIIVLAGLGGNFHVSRDGGATFTPWQPEDYNGGVSSLHEAKDGSLLVVGEKGAARLQLPVK